MGATASRAPPNSTEHDVLESLGRRTYIGTMGAGEFSQEGRQLSLGSKTPVAHGGNRKRRATALTVAASGLAALRRRLTRRRRSLSRKSGQGRAFREILLGWDVHSVHALLEEYRAIAALKQLYIQVARARPSTCDLAADFKELASSGSCSDVVLIFCGARFPAHRAILAARCPRLQPQLSTLSLDHNAELCLDLQLPDSITDSASFAVFLQHVYCGSVEVAVSADTNLLRHLSKEFPISSLPDTGYQVLLSGACYPYDSVLAFSASGEGADMPAALELPCHGAVLAARSPFFRAALERMLRAAQGVPTLPTRIVLDQTVLPGRYGRSLLHFLYTDCLELHLVEAGPVGLGFDRLGSLREVQAMVSGVSTCHNMEQAMELCHIARLLEIDILVQACEDELVAMLSIERLPSLLAWSSRGHGSEWVHRQALLFLCEEFSSIATSPALFQLSQDALLEALGSEYTQASEADILKAVVRWGEHQLLKRMDEREPNALNGTAHSMARRSARRRDLDCTELLELISPLLNQVRQDHIVPPTHDAFASAVKRGLITRPATQAMVRDKSSPSCPWIQAESDSPQLRPRLYMPFVEETKAVLQERMAEHTDLVRLHLTHPSPVQNSLHICATSVAPSHPEDPPSTPQCLALVDDVPVPSPMAICSMLRRQHEVQRSTTAIQACTLNPGRALRVVDLIQRQVLREHGLPDRVSELLQNPNKFYSGDVLITAELTVQPTKSTKLRSSFVASPPLPATSAEVAPLFPSTQEQAQENNPNLQSQCGPAPGSAGQFHSCPFYLPNTIENGDFVTLTGNDGASADTTPTQDYSNESIPDIAMAASSLDCILAGDKLSASSPRSNCCSGDVQLHTPKQNAFSLNMKPYFGEVLEERSGFISRSFQVKPSRSALYEAKDQLSRGLSHCETSPGSKRRTKEMCGPLPAVDILATSRTRLPESQTDLLLGHVLGPTDCVSSSPSIESSLEEIQTLLERSHIFGSTQVDGAAIRMLEPSFKKSAL